MAFRTYGVYPFPLFSKENGIHHSCFCSVTSGSGDRPRKEGCHGCGVYSFFPVKNCRFLDVRRFRGFRLCIGQGNPNPWRRFDWLCLREVALPLGHQDKKPPKGTSQRRKNSRRQVEFSSKELGRHVLSWRLSRDRRQDLCDRKRWYLKMFFAILWLFLLDFRAYNHGLKGPQKPKTCCDTAVLRSYLSPLFLLSVRSGPVWRQDLAILSPRAHQQNEIAPEKLLNRYEKWFEKREKNPKNEPKRAQMILSPSSAA